MWQNSFVRDEFCRRYSTNMEVLLRQDHSFARGSTRVMILHFFSCHTIYNQSLPYVLKICEWGACRAHAHAKLEEAHQLLRNAEEVRWWTQKMENR